MIFGKTKMELKVGVFVFIGMVILVIFLLSIGGFKTWSSGYRIKVKFGFVNGIKMGAPVRFAGVDVGEVKKIHLELIPEENRSVVHLGVWIRGNVKIPADSSVWVNTLGLLGEKYMEIIPGQDYGNFIKEDQTIAGIDPLPIHAMFNRIDNIMLNLDEGLAQIRNKEGSLGKLIYDDHIYNDLEGLVSDIRKNPWKLFFRAKEKK